MIINKQPGPRVQVGQRAVGTPALTPTATVRNYMEAPTPPARVPPALLLASALADIEPTLQRHLAVLHEERVAAQQAAAEKRLAGLTFEEARKLRAEGKLALSDDPWHRAAIERAYGIKLGQHRQEDLIRRLSGEATESGPPIDPENDDVDRILADIQRADLEGADAFVAGGYLSQMADTARRLRAKAVEIKSERAKERSIDAAITQFRATIEAGYSSGKSTDEIYSQIRAQYADLTKVLGLTPREIDDALVTVADAYAKQGRSDLVHKLLFDDRGGVGAIGTKRAYTARALRIMDEADEARRKNERALFVEAIGQFIVDASLGKLDEKRFMAWNAAHPGAITPGHVSELIARNRLAAESARLAQLKREQKEAQRAAVEQSERQLIAALVDAAERGVLASARPTQVLKPDGETGVKVDTLTPEQLRNRFVELYLGQISPLIAQQRKETPEQTILREMDIFRKNGLKHPVIASTLAAGYAAANAALEFEPGSAPPAIKDGYQLYKQLHAEGSAGWIESMTDRATVEFYEAVRVSERYMRLNEDQALANAIKITRDPLSYNKLTIERRLEDMQLAAEDVVNSMRGWFDKDVTNKQDVVSALIAVGSRYVALGLAPGDAIEAAKERVKETHGIINGVFVPIDDRTALAAFGGQFTEVATKFVKAKAEQLGLDPSDISLRPIGNSSNLWALVRDGIYPVYANDKVQAVTLDEIIAWRDAEAEKAARELAEEANRRRMKEEADRAAEAEAATKRPAVQMQTAPVSGQTPETSLTPPGEVERVLNYSAEVLKQYELRQKQKQQGNP
jgi:hypothetical protein